MDPQVAHHVHESPASMTGVLAVLAVLSAIGGFFALPHFLEPQLALPAVRPERAPMQSALVGIAIAIGFAGLAAAGYFYARGGARAARLAPSFGPLHRLLSGKYFIDELYAAVIGRPLAWISEHVFLRLGDRVLLDGTLNGLAALASRTAGQFGRLQTGSLHLYAFLVLAGTLACLLWVWRHV
jgi:NADH-quinone oxidoreductase subunit L